LTAEAKRDPGWAPVNPIGWVNFSGHWSRRITEERRLVYTVRDDDLIVVQAQLHY
jgi:toxin YoeB